MGTFRKDQKAKSPQHYLSYNYDKFKFVEANRDLSEVHVKEVMEEISNKDLSIENPVKVNRKFEIMEGQHTVVAYERLELPIRYIFTKMTIDDIGRFNSVPKRWAPEDVLNHYCVRGFEDYIIVHSFFKKYHYPISTLLILLSGENTKSIYKDFKLGTFEVKQSIGEVQSILDKIMEFKQFDNKVFRHRTFVLSYIDCLTHPDFNHDQMVHKVSVLPDRFMKKDTQRDYLLMIEDIYNYRRQEKQHIRLY